MQLPQQFQPYLERIDRRLQDSVTPELPVSLKEPIRYFLTLPGKKIRPLLTLFACEVVGGQRDAALPAATAVELFHDFTLIHDDIMDQDELRRGFQTMHVKYDNSTAILVGDALIGLAYRQLLQSPPACFEQVVKIFSEALVKVCEGQALDKEFESRRVVSLPEYLDMINKKTAWLIRISCEMGAIIGGGTPAEVEKIARFGDCLGLGFQIKDDLLDFVADEDKLGKQVGSDFRMHKKTYVTLKYQEVLQERPELQQAYPLDPADYAGFTDFQKALYALKIVEAVDELADRYIKEALDALAEVAPLDENNLLFEMTRFLERRQY